MTRKMVSILTAVSLLLYSTAMAQGKDEVVKNAMITVLTDGEPCTVYIDGEEIGESPVTLFVAPGKHKVRVVPDSGETKEKSAKAKANDRTVVRFKFPLPDPVKDALKGDFGEEESWGHTKIGMAVAGIVVIGGAIALAIHYGASGGLSSVHVSQRSIQLTVESDQIPQPDDDIIDLFVNNIPVFADYDLSNGLRTDPVILNSGSNLVEIVAKNEGTLAPKNTGILRITHVTRGWSVQDWSLSGGDTARMTIVAP
jgi:hypothetical protein